MALGPLSQRNMARDMPKTVPVFPRIGLILARLTNDPSLRSYGPAEAQLAAEGPRMTTQRPETAPDEDDALIACYTDWSHRYFDEWYGDDPSGHPPAVEMVRQALQSVAAENVLDAGCGPASMLRLLNEPNRSLHGFDVTPAMADEAQSVLDGMDGDGHRAWTGDATDPDSFHPPDGDHPLYDAILMIGVLTHISEEAQLSALQNLYHALRPGGVALIGVRNAMMGLFSMNRFSWELLSEKIIPTGRLRDVALERGEDIEPAFAEIQSRLRMDMPPNRGKSGPAGGYDDLPSRMHNPLELTERLHTIGFSKVTPAYYHYHPLPPWLRSTAPETFDTVAREMERPSDWRGLFTASAALLIAEKP